MSIILVNKLNFGVDQYDDVSKIEYNSSTKIYTITYGSGTVTYYDGQKWALSVLYK